MPSGRRPNAPAALASSDSSELKSIKSNLQNNNNTPSSTNITKLYFYLKHINQYLDQTITLSLNKQQLQQNTGSNKKQLLWNEKYVHNRNSILEHIDK